MKITNLCPNCGELVEYEYPANYFEYVEDEAIEGLICPHCGIKLVSCFEIKFSFYLRKARKEELEGLEFEKIQEE